MLIHEGGEVNSNDQGNGNEHDEVVKRKLNQGLNVKNARFYKNVYLSARLFVLWVAPKTEKFSGPCRTNQ
jgi:hypothetical protein